MCDQRRLRSACAFTVIRVTADRICLLQPLGYPKRDRRELLLYWVDVEADPPFVSHTGLNLCFVMHWLKLYMVMSPFPYHHISSSLLGRPVIATISPCIKFTHILIIRSIRSYYPVMASFGYTVNKIVRFHTYEGRYLILSLGFYRARY